MRQQLVTRGEGRNVPLIQLLPDHSMKLLTWMRVLLFSAHDKQYRVLTTKILPLGTSGFCVLTRTLTALSRSMCSSCSVTTHLVCFGPIEAFRGLMYV